MSKRKQDSERLDLTPHTSLVYASLRQWLEANRWRMQEATWHHDRRPAPDAPLVRDDSHHIEWWNKGANHLLVYVLGTSAIVYAPMLNGKVTALIKKLPAGQKSGKVLPDASEDGWRVMWNDRLTAPLFLNEGAANAYLQGLRKGRKPEFAAFGRVNIIPLEVGEGWTAEKRDEAPDKARPWELQHQGGHVGWFATFGAAVTEAHRIEGE